MNSPGLDRASIGLLLDLLEASEPRLSSLAFDLLRPSAERLIAAGLLEGAVHQDATTARNDPDRPVAVQWSPDEEAFGYFDPAEGWVRVDEALLNSYRVRVEEVVARLVGALGMRPLAPRQLLGDRLIDAGDIQLPGVRKRTPVWFARRLFDRTAWHHVRVEIAARPAATTRLVLTPTERARLPSDAPRGNRLTSLRDVLTDRLAIPGKVLALMLVGVPGEVRSDDGLVVIGDGREVRLAGEVFRIGGDKQRSIILCLHKHYLDGSYLVSVAEVMAESRLRLDGRVRDYFRRDAGKRVMTELLFERDGACGFRLPGLTAS